MTLDKAIKRLDTLQAELTIHPDGCPEPWRSWLVQAHEAMCRVIEKYREEHVVTPINFDPQLFDQAPCYLCGYNGEMYYQPTKHPCAKLYHRHVEEQA